MNNKKTIFFIIVLNIIIYGYSISFPFTHEVITRYLYSFYFNEITEPAKWILTYIIELEDRIRPLATLSFYLDYALYGLRAWGYHLSNLTFHIICVILVYFLLKELGISIMASMLSCMIFSSHISSAVVAIDLAKRNDSLCFIFYLVSLIFFIRYISKGTKKYIIISIIGFTISLLAKEMALSLAVLLYFIFCLIVHKRIFNGKWILFTDGVKTILPFIVISILYLLARLFLFRDIKSSFNLAKNIDISLIFHIINIFLKNIYILLFFKGSYFLLLLIPLYILLIYRLLDKKDSVLIKLSFILILIPLIPVFNITAPWYLYFSLVGYALLISSLIYRYYRMPRWILITLFLAIIIFSNLKWQIGFFNNNLLLHRITSEIKTIFPEVDKDDTFIYLDKSDNPTFMQLDGTGKLICIVYGQRNINYLSTRHLDWRCITPTTNVFTLEKGHLKRLDSPPRIFRRRIMSK